MKRVLDMCCGSRCFYFDKADPRVLACIEFETDFGPISARHSICLSPKLARMVAEELLKLSGEVS